ncbi:hypothetical protein AAFO92_12390 [Roseovarius sp. CAU 1744]|uniref:hypothetical protein n=1 Tax=Roseovarius sp. CAU 1744 TaxID=3140368 RepID=UPI00325AA676
MSKPVTNVEIEDVLSSIRRLVSTSDRVERGEVEPSDEVSDKLLLTPSLRVDDDAEAVTADTDKSVDDQDVAETEGEAFDTPETAGETTETDSETVSDEALLEKIAESAAVDRADEAMDSPAMDTDDAGPAEEQESAEGLDEILAETAENSIEIDEILPGGQDDAAEGGDAPEFLILDDRETEAEPGADGGDEAANNLQLRAAEFEEIIASTDDAWDPDGTTEDENAASPVGPVPWQDDGGQADTADAPGDEIDGMFEFAKSDLADETDDADDGSVEGSGEAEEIARSQADEAAGDDPQADVEAKDNDLARVMADVARECAEEDGSDAETEAEEALADDDPAPFVFRSQSTARHLDDDVLNPDDQAEDATTVAVEEAMLDEEALRDMVSDIVRQELQGALGERITRNVRKLVRREIHRALASQELE